jgi:hypothetical protein
MRFALDLVWLDGRHRVVRIDSGVGRRRHMECRRARSVLETAAGEGLRFAGALARDELAIELERAARDLVPSVGAGCGRACRGGHARASRRVGEK